MNEPDSIGLHLLREMRAEMTSGFAEARSEMKWLGSNLHNLDAKVDKTRKELTEQIVGLRRAVVEYHSAVIGHGMIISDSKSVCAASSSI